ncbi:hypothetical protein TI05_01065 [Achromatium sp. WMS3]|nr:hypothetical protein TI05_01065 [Achromatium sp. WMS3]
MKLNPEFSRLMTKYAELTDQGKGDTEEAMHLFHEALQYAPREFLDDIGNKAKEMGLLPDKPDGYTPDGQPLYNLEAMKKRLGIDEDEPIPDFILKDSYKGQVHRTQ